MRGKTGERMRPYRRREAMKKQDKEKDDSSLDSKRKEDMRQDKRWEEVRRDDWRRPVFLVCLLPPSFPRSPALAQVQVWALQEPRGRPQNLRGLREKKVIETMWDEASSGINSPYELTPRNLSGQKSGEDEEVPASRRSVNTDTNRRRKNNYPICRSKFTCVLNAGAGTQTLYTDTWHTW